jgi:hypothetical protein
MNEPASFRGPLAIVQSSNLRQDPQRTAHDGVPIHVIAAEITEMLSRGSLPARIDHYQEREQLVLHTTRHVIKLNPTTRQDAFVVGLILPTTLRTEAQVAVEGCLLHLPSCLLFEDIRSIGANFTIDQQRSFTTWPMLREALRNVDPPGDERSARHQKYLADVSAVIREVEKLDRQRMLQTGVLTYKAVSTAREQRYSGHDVYKFEVLERPVFGPGEQVTIDGEAPLRATVVRVTNRALTLRLPRTDLSAIASSGTLRLAPKSSVFRAQEQAVKTLREGRSLDPDLLVHLVDGETDLYTTDTAAIPLMSLDSSQIDVFQRALGIHDQLLVLGPPGTGKTRVLTAIAAAAVARGQRVLLASQTNQAVDNVLERLPVNVLAVRTGNEDSIAQDTRRLLPREQAQHLRRSIQSRSTDSARAYEFFLDEGECGSWLNELGAAWNEFLRADRIIASAQERYDHRAEEIRQANPLPNPSWFRRILTGERKQSAQVRMQAAESARSELLEADAAAQQALADRWAAQRAQDEAQRRCLDAAEVLNRELALALPDRDLPVQPLVPDWTKYIGDATRLSELARRRSDLLQDWGQQLESSEEVLEREVLRYAGVVATTCTGANRLDLKELEFDLALIDEAGQISTPDLLIPLVRARRHILVGDDRQLPPVVSEGAEEAFAALGRPELTTMLRRSTFEDLYRRNTTQAAHKTMLSVQRRMPDALARFISSYFYEGKLESNSDSRSKDPFFTSPLAFVDTSDQPEHVRRERKVQGSGPDRSSTYRNDFEATTAVQLIAERVRSGGDSAIIVPYRAQQFRISDLLNQTLGSGHGVDVGTVDRFQGGERDLIVFGFTRSNRNGTVGFLKELRRLNVAMTRARRQLILIGDAECLANASDPGFRAFMRDLLNYIESHGDRRPSADVHPPEGI